MAETKLTRTKVPNMKGKPKKKLGILKGKGRTNTTFRLKNQTLNTFNEVLQTVKKNISYKFARTDILESMVLWASKQSVETLKEILLNVEVEESEENNV